LQCVLHVVQLERLDDADDQLHSDQSPCSSSAWFSSACVSSDRSGQTRSYAYAVSECCVRSSPCSSSSGSRRMPPRITLLRTNTMAGVTTNEYAITEPAAST